MQPEPNIPAAGASLPQKRETVLFFLALSALLGAALFAHASSAAAFLSPLLLLVSPVPYTQLFFGARRWMPALVPLPALILSLLWLRDPVFALFVAAAALTSLVMFFSVRRGFSAFETVSFSALVSSVTVGGALLLWLFLLAQKQGTDLSSYLRALIDSYAGQYLLLLDSLRETLPAVSSSVDADALRAAMLLTFRLLPAYLAAFLSACTFFRLRNLLVSLRRAGVAAHGQEVWLPPVATAVIFLISAFSSLFLSLESVPGLAARYLTVLLTLPLAAVGFGVLAGIFSRGRGTGTGVLLLAAALLTLFTQFYFLYLLAVFGSAACFRLARARSGR